MAGRWIATGLGGLLMTLLGAPIAVMWVSLGCLAVAGAIVGLSQWNGNRRWREAGKRQRQRAENARLDRARKARNRKTQPPPRPPDPTKISTPEGCTPACYGASKPDPDGKCGCPCSGTHHGKGYELRKARRRAQRQAKGTG